MSQIQLSISLCIQLACLHWLGNFSGQFLRVLYINSSWRLFTEDNSQGCYYRELYSEHFALLNLMWLLLKFLNLPQEQEFVDTFSSSAAAAAQMHIYIARVILSAETCLEWGWCSQSQFWHIYGLWVSASARNSKTKGVQRIKWLALV